MSPLTQSRPCVRCQIRPQKLASRTGRCASCTNQRRGRPLQANDPRTQAISRAGGEATKARMARMRTA